MTRQLPRMIPLTAAPTKWPKTAAEATAFAKKKNREAAQARAARDRAHRAQCPTAAAAEEKARSAARAKTRALGRLASKYYGASR